MTSWHDTNIRWFVLVLIGIYPLVVFLVGEFPALLGEQIKQHFQITQKEVNYLLSIRAFPNMIMSLVGGLIIDTFGVGRSYTLFGAVIILGQFLCFISVISDNFAIMVVGRLVFGLFDDSGFVAESYYINKWFKGKENSLAFGIDTGLCRIGSITGAIIYPYIYMSQDNDLSKCLLMCLYISILSFVLIIILTRIDKCSDSRDKTEDQKLESVDLRQIKNFSLEFYVALISCATTYSIFFIFGYNCYNLLPRYKLDQSTANLLFSIPHYISAALTVFVGHYVDRKGRNIEILLFGGFCQVLAAAIFYLMPECDTYCVAFPVIGSILIGIFFGTYYAVMWPYIPKIVPSNLVGTGFGLTYACINIEITIFSIIISHILEVENYENYTKMNTLLLFLSFVGFLPLLYLYKFHRTQYHQCNVTQETESQIELIDRTKSL
ncbi:unnamed protein product (macronuclear) [Paramecium tetraurelia]|uniref:Lysosomal dipeptide transporter MFSD1 n=1 Tax=Paramecium tetraurelia TaxID=5888 RepID=A0EIT6_PARTE|nr:uncharacterized protein GSPATT00027556001 [Paramecium tetraurelia]CAK95227.1 unnamed protein product [Paramecium tetraurelia]|eukprot:XP_001462600.1 hypothetical protein (macronuclear) [Paramecium tetraurelia strain d4-2]